MSSWGPWQSLHAVTYFYPKVGTNSALRRLSHNAFSSHSLPSHTRTEHREDMQKPPSSMQTFFSLLSRSHSSLPGHCSTLSCHHWFPGLHIPTWESGLLTWFGHPENNSVLSVSSWSPKLQSDFFPKICYCIICVHVCRGYICACVCKWVLMNVSFGPLCSPVTSFP